jgi:hypothetical protein
MVEMANSFALAPPANSLIQKFEEAVFLIAHGLIEKEELLSSNENRYPYSPYFRLGMNKLAALVVQYSETAEEDLRNFNESDFIREIASKEVSLWITSWAQESREELRESKYFDIGPLILCDSEGHLFQVTDECYEIDETAEAKALGGHQQREVYQFLKEGTQEEYVQGRLFLIRNPVLESMQAFGVKNGKLNLSSDPLYPGYGSQVSTQWSQQLLDLSYENIPSNMKVCPHCGWTISLYKRQPRCSSEECCKITEGEYRALNFTQGGSLRLRAGLMHYFCNPGKLELEIAEKLVELGVDVELWPEKDTCDIKATLKDGKTIAVDAKAYSSAQRLANEIKRDYTISTLGTDEVVYVVPDQAKKDNPDFCKICNNAVSKFPDKKNYECMTLRDFFRKIKRENGGK